jgi:hypothetical protein
MECIAKKRGWTNEDGTINKETVTASMTMANKTTEWDPLVVEAQEKCFSELKASGDITSCPDLINTDRAIIVVKTTDGCSADSQQFLYCIFEHHFLV